MIFNICSCLRMLHLSELAFRAAYEYPLLLFDFFYRIVHGYLQIAGIRVGWILR